MRACNIKISLCPARNTIPSYHFIDILWLGFTPSLFRLPSVLKKALLFQYIILRSKLQQNCLNSITKIF